MSTTHASHRLSARAPLGVLAAAVLFASPAAFAQTDPTAGGTLEGEIEGALNGVQGSLQNGVQNGADAAESALDRTVDDVLYIDASSPSASTRSTAPGATTQRRDDGDGFYFDDSPQQARIVHPVTAPTYNDDAFITTDVRGHYINQQFPTNAVTNGGAVRVYGLQLRYALNEEVQLQISKLGLTDLHLGPVAEYGLDDAAIAIKYAFLQDWEARTHASIGLGYELGIGDEDTFGDDSEFRLFGAFNKGFDRSNLGVSLNAMFATGSEDASGDSDRLSAHLHYDYELNDQISPLVELNYYKTLSNGDNVTPFSGIDLASLGGNEDEDVMTLGLGGEFRLQNDLALRLAYESPLTDNVDLFGYRWTASAVWRF